MCAKDFVVNSKQSVLIDFGLLQAWKMIALSRRKMDVPLIKVWVREMTSCVALEKLTYVTRRRAGEFEEIWKPLMDFIGHQGALSM